ncbi:MAG: histidine--tRNA ligase, partial [Spirochaetales bacterium]
VPIDTPVLEYSEILLRKSEGETEKQVFRFTDNGGRDVALRFDLTVPFARFVAEHKDELYFPFKRYHIAKVWRGEKPQAGRYREFVQCDFDIVGSDTAATDFEILELMKKSLDTIGAEHITIRINHRGLFNTFLSRLELSDKSEEILRVVDKLAKVGREEVQNQLEKLTESLQKAQDILTYIAGSTDFNTTLKLIGDLAGHTEATDSFIYRLHDVHTLLKTAHIENFFVLDPSITRGLDYYTGIVFETFLNDLPSIGSICSGGRYDNLAGLYMKEKVSGIGSSIGLDRLLAGLEQLNFCNDSLCFLDAEIFCVDEKLITHYQSIAETLRKNDIAVEIFPEAKKLVRQYATAEKKGVPFGILISEEQASQDVLTVKNLKTREQYENISIDEAIKILKK